MYLMNLWKNNCILYLMSLWKKIYREKNNSMEYIRKNRLKYPNQTEQNRWVWFGFIFEKHKKPNQAKPIEDSLVRTLNSLKTDLNRSNYTPTHTCHNTPLVLQLLPKRFFHYTNTKACKLMTAWQTNNGFGFFTFKNSTFTHIHLHLMQTY
jgi:hypothetical protein